MTCLESLSKSEAEGYGTQLLLTADQCSVGLAAL